MANPVMRESIFSKVGPIPETYAGAIEADQVMTVNGTINKTGFLLLILAASSVFSWSMADTGLGAILAIVGTVIGFGIAIALVFRPMWAPIAAPVYAVAEGLLVGFASAMFDHSQPGIAANALMLTFGIMALMLGLYHFGILRATPRFTKTVIFATFGIAFIYIADMIMGFFGIHAQFIHGASPTGIVFSLAVSVIAALNLIIDFGFVESGAARRAPKWMEWYASFALMVTIVWLYLEMLRLLGRFNRR